MKNDSWMFPTETPMDSLFDSNKDGELTGFETTMRDAALFEMYNNTTEDSGSNNVYSSNQKNYKIHTPSNTTSDSEQYDAPSDSTILWSCIGVIAIIIGAFAIILRQETRNDLLNAIVMFFSVALSIGLLKITGVIAPNKKNVESDDEIDDSDSYCNAINDCFNYESDDRNE